MKRHTPSATLECPICGGAMAARTHDWLYCCSACGFLRATLTLGIEDPASRAMVSEPLRAQALNSLRLANFKRVLDRLQRVVAPKGLALLDVGCAHGWFLDGATAQGYLATGLEPDPAIGADAAAGGRTVLSGFFPDDVPAGAVFDVISFNDVFEHLPDINQAMEACNRLLRPGGLLVLNVPCRSGIFYRLSAFLDGLGICGPLERLWQIHFASPHFSYFTPKDLRRLAGKNSFREVHASTLPSVQLRGLWARLNYDTSSCRAVNALVWVAVAITRPFLPLLPADITLQIFRKD